MSEIQIISGSPAAPDNGASDAAQIEKLTSLVVRCPELREMEKLLGKFNLFRVLRFEHGEIRHSNVLAWLLDPEESHGLRDLFLRRWLMRVFSEEEPEQGNVPDPVLLDSCEIRTVEVLREWRHLDLLVGIQTQQDGLWVVAIENKVRARQGEGQLGKYRRQVEESFKSAARRVFIFLTQQDEEPEDPHYTRASYRQVFEVLRDCVEEQRDIIGGEPRVMMNHYLAILEELFMEDSKVANLARRIYQSHRDALDIILEHRPDELQNLSGFLEEKMKSDPNELKIVPMLCTKGLVRFMPASWQTEKNLRGEAWGGSGSAFILCEVSLWSRWPLFKIVEGKAPDAWRNELWDLSLTAPFKKTQKRNKKPEMWMGVYSVKNTKINLSDLEFGHEEETAEKVWEWVKGQFLDKDFQGVVGIIEGHLKSLP